MLGKSLGTKETLQWQEPSDRHCSYLAGSLEAHLTHNLADDLELFCSLTPFVLGIHGSVFDSFVALDSHLASASDGVGDLRAKSTSHSKWHVLHPKRVRFRPTDTGFKAAHFREGFWRDGLCVWFISRVHCSSSRVLMPVNLNRCGEKIQDKPSQRRKHLFGCMVAEGSVHGYLALLFWGLGWCRIPWWGV